MSTKLSEAAAKTWSRVQAIRDVAGRKTSNATDGAPTGFAVRTDSFTEPWEFFGDNWNVDTTDKVTFLETRDVFSSFDRIQTAAGRIETVRQDDFGTVQPYDGAANIGFIDGMWGHLTNTTDLTMGFNTHFSDPGELAGGVNNAYVETFLRTNLTAMTLYNVSVELQKDYPGGETSGSRGQHGIEITFGSPDIGQVVGQSKVRAFLAESTGLAFAYTDPSGTDFFFDGTDGTWKSGGGTVAIFSPPNHNVRIRVHMERTALSYDFTAYRLDTNVLIRTASVLLSSIRNGALVDDNVVLGQIREPGRPAVSFESAYDRWDNFQLAPAAPSGVFTSTVLSSSHPQGRLISLTAATNGDVGIQVRSGNDYRLADATAWRWIVSGQILNDTEAGFWQYRVFVNTSTAWADNVALSFWTVGSGPAPDPDSDGQYTRSMHWKGVAVSFTANQSLRSYAGYGPDGSPNVAVPIRWRNLTWTIENSIIDFGGTQRLSRSLGGYPFVFLADHWEIRVKNSTLRNANTSTLFGVNSLGTNVQDICGAGVSLWSFDQLYIENSTFHDFGRIAPGGPVAFRAFDNDIQNTSAPAVLNMYNAACVGTNIRRGTFQGVNFDWVARGNRISRMTGIPGTCFVGRFAFWNWCDARAPNSTAYQGFDFTGSYHSDTPVELFNISHNLQENGQRAFQAFGAQTNRCVTSEYDCPTLTGQAYGTFYRNVAVNNSYITFQYSYNASNVHDSDNIVYNIAGGYSPHWLAQGRARGLVVTDNLYWGPGEGSWGMVVASFVHDSVFERNTVLQNKLAALQIAAGGIKRDDLSSCYSCDPKLTFRNNYWAVNETWSGVQATVFQDSGRIVMVKDTIANFASGKQAILVFDGWDDPAGSIAQADLTDVSVDETKVDVSYANPANVDRVFVVLRKTTTFRLDDNRIVTITCLAQGFPTVNFVVIGMSPSSGSLIALNETVDAEKRSSYQARMPTGPRMVLDETTGDEVPFQQVGGIVTFAVMPGHAYLVSYTQPEIEWTRQFGAFGPSFERIASVVTDVPNLYVAGWVTGAIPGEASHRGDDAFLRKYDASGAVLWTRQFGTSGDDRANAVGVDASGVYVAGGTGGGLSGYYYGAIDAFVRKYDASGTELWTRQFGASGYLWDIVTAMSVDASGILVAGSTQGALPGQNSSGGTDAFVRKYDASGTELWTRQFGTPSDEESALTVSADASDIYVGGFLNTSEGFVRKYASDGTEVWTRQLVASGRVTVAASSAGASGVFVAGRVGGDLPGQTSSGGDDAFVRKYDPDGNELWTRQFGTSNDDSANALSVDTSSVYIAGTSDYELESFVRKYTSDGTETWARQLAAVVVASSIDASGIYVAGGTLWTSADSGDALIRKYDANGDEVWTRQFGAIGPSRDRATGIAVAGSSVYVVGWTLGGLPGQSSNGYEDAFVRKYTISGILSWTRQFGTPDRDYAFTVSADASGIYVGGVLNGSAGFVRKYASDGTEVWTRQIEASSYVAVTASWVDVSGIYVAGHVDGALPGQNAVGGLDAFVRKYDASGTEIWTIQFGTIDNEFINAVSEGAFGLCVGGSTSGGFPGYYDPTYPVAFFRVYDLSGVERWTQQFGAEGNSAIMGCAVAPSGIYVAGHNFGDALLLKFDQTGSEVWARYFEAGRSPNTYDQASSLSVIGSAVYVAGSTDQWKPGGLHDGFVRRYDVSGTEIWTRQFGSPGDDEALSIVADSQSIYVAGFAEDALPGQIHMGDEDAFVMRLAQEAPRRLRVDLSGEFDYLERERVRIAVSAHVRDAESLEPATGADVTIAIYRGPLRLLTAPMVEVVSGAGIYQWMSSNTIRNLWFLFTKGVYLAVVEASVGAGPVSRAILEFHIDPPGEQQEGNDGGQAAAPGFSSLGLAGAVIASMTLTAALLRRREIARTFRRWRGRP